MFLRNFVSGAAVLAALGAPFAAAQGKFLTAAEVKPILTATKGNWIAVREFNGQDLLYFTHLLAWRCGLDGISYAVNGSADMQPWPVVPCDEDAANPAAISEDQKIYETFDLRLIETITVKIIYDDGSEDQMEYTRKSVQIN